MPLICYLKEAIPLGGWGVIGLITKPCSRSITQYILNTFSISFHLSSTLTKTFLPIFHPYYTHISSLLHYTHTGATAGAFLSLTDIQEGGGMDKKPFSNRDKRGSADSEATVGTSGRARRGSIDMEEGVFAGKRGMYIYICVCMCMCVLLYRPSRPQCHTT